MLLPLLDGSLVALQGSAHRLLRAPVHLAKNLPDVPGVIADAKLVFDQVRHSITGPQRRFVAQTLWSLPQQPDQPLLVGGAEPALAARSSGLPQGRLPACPILLPPAAHGLIANSQTASDLAIVQLLAEPPDGPQPSLLQGVKIPSHSSWVSHTSLEPHKARKIPLYYAGFSNYEQFDFVKEIRRLTGDGVDVVFDGVGGTHLWRSLRAIRAGGKVVAYGLTSTLHEGKLSGGPRHRLWGLASIGCPPS